MKKGNKHPTERRHNHAPLGRPPENRKARKEYNKLKKELTPYGKSLISKKSQDAINEAYNNRKRKKRAAKKSTTGAKSTEDRLKASYTKRTTKKPAIKKQETKYVGPNRPSDLSIEKLRTISKGISGYKSVKKDPKTGEYVVTFQHKTKVTPVYIKFRKDPSGYRDAWSCEYDVSVTTKGKYRFYDTYAGMQDTPGVEAVLKRASSMTSQAMRAEERDEAESDRIREQLAKWTKR